MAEMFEEAWWLWYGEDVDWWSLKRENKKTHSKFAAKKAAKAKYTTPTRDVAAVSKSAALKSRVAALTLAKTSPEANPPESTSSASDFASGAATGVAIGAVSLLGAFIALRACQRKSSDTSDNFQRLLQ